MTDTKLERIINQLADLTEEEEIFIIDKISEAREKKRHEKFRQLYDNFLDTARELEKLGYCLCWSGDRIDLNDLYFE